MMLDDILRSAPHTLAPPEEKLVARAGAMRLRPQRVFDLHQRDLPYPEITLSNGEKVRSTPLPYSLYPRLAGEGRS